jgi:hypothetical protein
MCPALAHTTAYCCTAMDCDGGRFSLQDLIPGKLPDSSPPPLAVQKPKRMVYHPTNQRPYLEFRLIEWLQREHLADPCRAVRPPELILSENQRASLVCADPKTLKSAKDITALLQESDEWDDEWSEKLFEVVTKFEVDYACIKGQKATQKKGKRT